MWKPKKFFTEQQVEAAQTAKGGFSRNSLSKLGVPWPPPKGWRKAITKPELPRWANPNVTRVHEAAAIVSQERIDAAEAWPEFPLARFWFRKHSDAILH
jgi:hypothetical protein